MNKSGPCRGALALALCIPFVLAHAAPADQAPVSETPAAKAARAEREAVAEKQKQLFDDKNIPVEPQAGPTTLIDLPQDEADAPGAVKP
jgi:hypothetical protein